MLNDLASDEDGEDYDEGYEDDERDEGSEYQPSENTSQTRSELDMEAVSTVEDLVESIPEQTCKFLLLLPRELRDKVRVFSANVLKCVHGLTAGLRVQIYALVLRLDTPMSDHQVKFKCISCPNLMGTANISTWQSQVHEVRNILRTCHQIRDEGKEVFFNVNSWSLHRVRLRERPGPASAVFVDTQRLFDRLHQNVGLKRFKQVNMRISLSPLAYCDLAIADNIALDDPVSVRLFESTHPPGIIAFHKLDEKAQCELFRAAINCFVNTRMHVFPSMRLLTLEVSFHAKKCHKNGPNSPLDRCGITFYVRIRLGATSCLTATCNGNASIPVLASSSVVYNPSTSQRAQHAYEAHKYIPQLSVTGGGWVAPLLDHRRHMLSPLRQLFDVRSVEVERRWTVIYRQPSTVDGSTVVREQPLRQLWRFYTVGEMLERAGPGFEEFLDPALEYLKTSPNDVVDIVENTWNKTEDLGHLLIRE